MLIRIARLGTSVKEVHLDTGRVDDALAARGLSAEGFQIRVNGQIVTGRKLLHDGDLITLLFADGIRGEYDVKVNNQKWRVHRNDPDRVFPSDFHAHNKSSRRETVDVYTGNVYDPATKQLTRKLSKKHFGQLLAELSRKSKRKEPKA